MDVVNRWKGRAALPLSLAGLLALTVGGALIAVHAPVAAQVATPVATTAPLDDDTPVTPLLGEATTWGALGVPGHARLAVFATAWCASCRAEVPAVEAWAAEHAERVDVVYVFSGSAAERIGETVAEHGPRSPGVVVVVDSDGALASHFGVRATPTLLFWDDPRASGRQVEHLEDIELADASLAPGSDVGRVVVADSGEELGTSYDVFVVVAAGAEERARADLAEARSLVRALERRFSEWREDSEISALNAAIARGEGAQGVALAPDLARLVAGAVHVSEVSAGAFDPCWRPLGDLWDAAATRGTAPDPAEVAEALSHTGAAHLRLDGERLFVDDAAVRLGLEGVAKGWIVDAAFEFLRRAGYSDLVVNIGGDLRTAGRDAEGRRIQLRLLDPYAPERALSWLELEDTAVATSGNYFRGRSVGGRRVGHVLDPRTGQGAEFDGSVTVLTRDAAMADALATALLVLGPDEGMALVERLDHVEAVFATRDGLLASTGAIP